MTRRHSKAIIIFALERLADIAMDLLRTDPKKLNAAHCSAPTSTNARWVAIIATLLELIVSIQKDPFSASAVWAFATLPTLLRPVLSAQTSTSALKTATIASCTRDVTMWSAPSRVRA